MSELEKLVIAVATGIFLFVFSDNIGRLIYGPTQMVLKQGFNIKVEDTNREIAQQPTTLPEVLDMKAIMAAADPTKGEATFKKVCTLCHNGDKGGPNKVGPNLWGIVDGPAAHKADFNYSEAMLQRRASGVPWSEEQLYRYLYAPKQYVVGTKMSFAGIKDDKERADLVAYLNTMK
jgi:cytochrome c